jgi:hypothetical protein
LAQDPGLSNAAMSLVHVEVDEDDEVNKNPKQHPMDVCIHVDAVPVNKFLQTLQGNRSFLDCITEIPQNFQSKILLWMQMCIA